MHVGARPCNRSCAAPGGLVRSYAPNQTRPELPGNAGGQLVTNSPPGLRPASASRRPSKHSWLRNAPTRRRRRLLRVRRDRATWPGGALFSKHSVLTHHWKRTRNGSYRPSCCRDACFLFPAVCYAASFSRAIPACGRRVFYLFSLQKIVFYLSVNWFRSTFLPPTSEVTDHQSSRGSLGFTSPPTVAAKFSTSVLPTKGK